ncbi:hypothetical protein LMG23992_00362 [Cupriavidus laharis]|uniref:Uncharacterized protein n=1 Tax=Cupriavidus laharis TaxID=151654 RepID=A0ABM8WD30_9BURK|nr:hypothetical protein [Cupriavidus laharis]CAG9165218.1 hypothetical protein LMG23992_00362 [Cupriavidus laharis]
MPSVTAQSAANIARVEVYSQYRDMLIQYLFVSKAQRYLLQVETLELVSDQVLRRQLTDRRHHLANRQAKLDAALAGLMSNPLIDHRNTGTRSTGAGGGWAAGIRAPTSRLVDRQPSANYEPMPPVVEAVDCGYDFGTATGEGDWLISSTPSTNINGLPMVGAVDIHGNPYGYTALDSNNGF